MIFFALKLQSFKLGLLGIVALYALMFALPVSFLLGVPLLAFLPRFLPFSALTCLTAGAALASLTLMIFMRFAGLPPVELSAVVISGGAVAGFVFWVCARREVLPPS
jgi:hypothetical protein